MPSASAIFIALFPFWVCVLLFRCCLSGPRVRFVVVVEAIEGAGKGAGTVGGGVDGEKVGGVGVISVSATGVVTVVVAPNHLVYISFKSRSS